MTEIKEQQTETVTPEILLAQIVSAIGEEFVVIPLEGWVTIVENIHQYTQKAQSEEGTKENLLEIMESLKVPVIPVSLSKKEESRIITPDGMPAGDSKIIT
jgi:hypothetical protein